MASPRSSDLIDRVDDRDVVVGSVRRGEALGGGIGFRTVQVVVRNDRGHLLLQQVGRQGTRHPGRWGASVATYLHAGEEPAAGAQRRLREEIGLDAPVHPLGVVHMLDEGSSKFVHIYGTVAEAAVVQDPGHVADLVFWSPRQIRDQLAKDPDVFTATFPLVFEAIDDH